MRRSSAANRSPVASTTAAARTSTPPHSRSRRSENSSSGSHAMRRNAVPESHATLRRSTRRAAAKATERLKEQAVDPRKRAAVRGSKHSPISLDEEDEGGGLGVARSAGISAGGVAVAAAASRALVTATALVGHDGEPFQCPICLEHPSRCDDVATISGCNHRFCFECIDTWAGTENKCPLCKERFRTITRLNDVAPAAAAAAASANAAPSTRGLKRKSDDVSSETTTASGRRTRSRREAAATSSNAPSPPSSAAADRVSSRTVEDRNQISTSTISMDGTLLNQIIFQTLARAMNSGDEGLNARINARGATFRVRTGNGHVIQMVFGTQGDSDSEDEEENSEPSENGSPTGGGGSGSNEEPVILLDELEE